MTLVTGGAGFIGSAVVRRLVADGESVRILDDFSTGEGRELADLPGVELVEGDLTDAAVVEAAVNGAHRVVHLAAVSSVPTAEEQPERAAEVNVGGTLSLLRASRRAGVSAFAFASSCAVYGDGGDQALAESGPVSPESVYAVTKVAAERHVLQHHRTGGPPGVALRFFNVYGVGDRADSPYARVIANFSAAALAGERPEVHGDGEQTRDFVHRSDVVEAILLALDRASGEAGGEAFNVASGRRLSVLDIWRLTAAAAGVDLSPRFAPLRPGDVRHAFADTGKAERLLGFRAAVRLEDGIAEVLAAKGRSAA